MEKLYRSYLTFLRSMGRGLETLIALNEKKLDAVRTDDLAALNELVNEEQAQSLNFRGLELTRDKLLPQLGLVNVPLSEVPGRCPPAFQEEVRQAVEDIQKQYQAYRRISGQTRSMLEQTRHEVDAAIVEMGGSAAPGQDSPGYRREEASAPPPSMRTDFRA